jgi:hypothetical protein
LGLIMQSVGRELFLGKDLSSPSVAIPTLIWSPNIHPRERDTKYYDKLKCRGNKLGMQEDRLMCSNSKLLLFCAQEYVHATGYFVLRNMCMLQAILCSEICACYRLFCAQKYVHATGYFVLRNMCMLQAILCSEICACYRLFHEKMIFISRVRYYSRCSDLLTPWCRVLLEKLTGFQLVKKFPAFYGTRRFITAVTSDRHLSLSSASSIHSIHPHPTSWRSILILSFHLRLGLQSGIFPSGFPTKTLVTRNLN